MGLKICTIVAVSIGLLTSQETLAQYFKYYSVYSFFQLVIVRCTSSDSHHQNRL